MKNKITKIWGVGLIVVLLASLLVIAAPASAADPLQWNDEGIPGPPASQLVPGLEILDFAVASDGMTVYAVGLIRGAETATATCTTNFTAGLAAGETLAVEYINENGVARTQALGTAGTMTFVGTANTTLPTTAVVTPFLNDTGIKDVTNVIEVGSTATAGVFSIISDTTAVNFGNYSYATATWTDLGTAVADTTAKLYKSNNAGATWTDITPTAVGLGITNTQLVAVAPDDPNIVVVADGTTAQIAAGTAIYVSTDGGTNFGSLGIITGVGGVANTIHDLQISPRVSPGIRYIACPGRVGALGDNDTPGLFIYDLHAASPAWRNVVNIGPVWTTGLGATEIDDFWAFAFSPSFAADFTGAVIGNYVGGAGVGKAKLQLHTVSFNLKRWNGLSTSYPVDVVTAAAANTAFVVQAADLALAPDFVGGDDVSRVYFAGCSVLDNAVEAGGIFRCDDTSTPIQMRVAAINSVDFNGTDLVAGSFDGNTVFRSADPLAATPTVRPSRADKEIGIDSVAPTVLVNDQVIVTWNGEDVLGSKRGAASAFSISRDNGLSWNDRSLIDSGYPYVIDDMYVTEDAGKVYVCAHDTAETSVYRGVMGSFERVLTINNINGYIVRGTPADSDILYVADVGGTAIFYTSAAGDERWYGYTAVVSAGGITDLAAENDDVVYVGDATTVVKSVNNGFTWDPPVTPELSGDAVVTLYSIAEDKLIAGGNQGHVSYTTDGNETWFRIIYPIKLPPAANNVQVLATGLDAGDKILASGTAAGNGVYQWTVGGSPMAEWVAIKTNIAASTGIAYVGGALYVSTNDGASVIVQRCLNPLGPGGWSWSTMTDTGAQDNGAVSILKVSTGSNKIWYANNAAGVRSYQDTLVDIYPEVTGPADGTLVSVNPVTGRSSDVAFNWNRPSLNTQIYELAIYTDPKGFNQVASINIPNPGPFGVVLVGPYQTGYMPYSNGLGSSRQFEWVGGQTYYWKVRVSALYGTDGTGPPWTGPIYSQWSPLRSLVIESGAASVPQISSPVNGATNVGTKPAFSWSPVEGATEYEFQLDSVTTFAVPLFSTNLSETGIAPDVTLETGQTYFWRVRATAPNIGSWSTIANFTVAVPAAEEKPTEITIPEIKVPEITIPEIKVPETKVVVQEAEKVTEPAISEGLLLAIIIIGAVLVIALIVLIVRTRRQV